MEEIDKILEDKILREFKENRRGFLNKLRSKSYQHIKQYIWDRFPMLQCKKYSFGMHLYWLEMQLVIFQNVCGQIVYTQKNNTNSALFKCAIIL